MHFTLFISDLHLDAAHPERAQHLLDLLSQHPTMDALYILGDFFEAWVGDYDDPFYQKVMAALNGLSAKKIPVFFMVGNRDFLIDQQFTKYTGATLIKDPSVIQLYGKTVLLMHGDSLCVLDKHYQRFRKLSRLPLVKKLFLLLPLPLRKKIAQSMRDQSRRYTAEAAPAIMDVVDTEVLKVMDTFDAEVLIHGHTHRPAVHHLPGSKKRYVLGAWEPVGEVLTVNDQGAWILQKLE